MAQGRFEVILFDLGGVVIELTGVAQMCAWTGIADDEELWPRWLTSPGVRSFGTGRVTAEEFAAAMCLEFGLPVGAAEFMAEFALWPSGVFPGAHELLGALASRHRLVALSNNNAVHWERISRDMGLGRYFSASFLSHEIGLIKPDRAVFEHVAEALGSPPGRILFLDDNRLNVEQAASVGMVAHRVAGVEQTAALMVELGLLEEGEFRPTAAAAATPAPAK